MGRSRGSLTQKIHAMVDANRPLIRLVLGEGQTYDQHGAQVMPEQRCA